MKKIVIIIDNIYLFILIEIYKICVSKCAQKKVNAKYTNSCESKNMTPKQRVLDLRFYSKDGLIQREIVVSSHQEINGFLKQFIEMNDLEDLIDLPLAYESMLLNGVYNIEKIVLRYS